MVCTALALALVTASPSESWQLRQRTTDRVMLSILGGWAVVNLVGGSIGAAASTEPQARFFHLGNAVWNVVNFGLSVVGLLRDLLQAPQPFDAAQALREAHQQEKVLLLNIGLDVAYLATAAFLWQRGEAVSDVRLVGAGHALLLQGGFLLVFDTVYALLAGGITRALEPLLSITPNGGATLGFNARFD
jgi:hypothetical protein